MVGWRTLTPFLSTSSREQINPRQVNRLCGRWPQISLPLTLAGVDLAARHCPCWCPTPPSQSVIWPHRIQGETFIHQLIFGDVESNHKQSCRSCTLPKTNLPESEFFHVEFLNSWIDQFKVIIHWCCCNNLCTVLLYDTQILFQIKLI